MAGRLVLFDHHNPLFGRQRSWDLWNDPWNFDVSLPLRLFDQHFGMGMSRRPVNQQATGMSEVKNTENEFQVSLDVSHFKPEELTIKMIDNRVVIHGKHEEKQDEHGFIQREFTRSYVLPKNVDIPAVKSSLSADGILSITAPKLAVEGQKETNIPIQMG